MTLSAPLTLRLRRVHEAARPTGNPAEDHNFDTVRFGDALVLCGSPAPSVPLNDAESSGRCAAAENTESRSVRRRSQHWCSLCFLPHAPPARHASMITLAITSSHEIIMLPLSFTTQYTFPAHEVELIVLYVNSLDEALPKKITPDEIMSPECGLLLLTIKQQQYLYPIISCH